MNLDFLKSRAFRAIGLAIALLVGGELLLQVRAHLRYGHSALRVLTKDSPYYEDAELGIKRIKPNAVISGNQSTIRANSLGLRSPEIDLQRKPDEVRIAIIGGSTVMGQSALTNDDTFSAVLQTLLREKFPDRTSNVINAGMGGYRIAEQLILLREVILPLEPQLVILYPGQNDINRHTRLELSPSSGAEQVNHGLPGPKLPKWVLSESLLSKNTVWLRPQPQRTLASGLSEDGTVPFQETLDALIELLEDRKIPLLICLNVTSYSRDLPMDEQLRLSELTRYYNKYLSIEGLHAARDMYNTVISRAALAHDIPVLDLPRLIPAGTEYFADSIHFNRRGEDFISDLILDTLGQLGLLDDLYGPPPTAANSNPRS